MSYVLWQQSFLPKDKTNSSNSPPPHSLKFRNDHGQAASTWSLSLWAKGLCLTCCWKISDVLCLNVTRKIVLLSMVRNFLVDTSFQFFRSSFLMYVLLYISSVIFVLPKPHQIISNLGMIGANALFVLLLPLRRGVIFSFSNSLSSNFEESLHDHLSIIMNQDSLRVTTVILEVLNILISQYSLGQLLINYFRKILTLLSREE